MSCANFCLNLPVSQYIAIVLIGNMTLIPAISTMTETVPVSLPTVAWQVYCPAWDWRSGLMMRV